MNIKVRVDCGEKSFQLSDLFEGMNERILRGFSIDLSFSTKNLTRNFLKAVYWIDYKAKDAQDFSNTVLVHKSTRILLENLFSTISMESVSKTPNTTLKGKWQWKSNSDPWSEAEQAQWTFYSAEHNYLLEKAEYDKKSEVDLGDFIVSIQHMRQYKKGNITKQRPIRKIAYGDDEADIRSKRYYETELPKTINKIFGSLKHFVDFFESRSPEVQSFTSQWVSIQESENNVQEFNRVILPLLTKCLEEELLKPIEGQLSDSSVSGPENKILIRKKARHEALISLFRKDLASFEEFYGLIVKSYTMSTDLHINLNKYLKNEDWTAMDTLLPYVICLCISFPFFKCTHGNEEASSLKTIAGSIILYRGTALDEFALSSYRETSKLFSWNSVTSTSRNREIAEKFMYESVDIQNKKYPVLFIIEIPLEIESEGSEYANWIDIRKYSAMPAEDEVILAPGSTFELEEISTHEESRTTIKIKLKHDIQSLADGGLVLQGVIQNNIRKKDSQINIEHLSGEELFETLKNLSGNRFIKEIEFNSCIFNKRALEEMLLILATLQNARLLILTSCKFEDEQDISTVRLPSVKACNILEIRMVQTRDFFEILSLNQHCDNFWIFLESVVIDFSFLEFDDNEFRLFKLPKQITSLKLNFERCRGITDEGLNNLTFQVLKYLTQLTCLKLYFPWCNKITDEGIKILASQGIKSLAHLTSLELDFSFCEQITDEVLKNLTFQALKNLTQLTSLALHFYRCEMTNEGMNYLSSQGLNNLTQLTSLHLNFAHCQQITDEGVNSLTFQGVKHLTQLTSLALDFSGCGEITDEAVKNLFLQIFTIYSLRPLCLNLHFSSFRIDRNWPLSLIEAQELWDSGQFLRK